MVSLVVGFSQDLLIMIDSLIPKVILSNLQVELVLSQA